MRSTRLGCVAVGVVVTVLAVRMADRTWAEDQPSGGGSAAPQSEKKETRTASGFSLVDPTHQRPREGWLLDVSRNDADKRKALLSALQVVTSLQCDGLPLREAIRQVLAPTKVRVKFDQKAIDDDGTVSLDDPVTHATENEPVEAILFDLLQPRGLTWIPRGDSVVITTWTEADATLETMAYDVTELVVCPTTGKADVSKLISAMCDTVDPDSWVDVGGQGRIEPIAHSKSAVLIVRQTFGTHRKLGNFISGLNESGLVSELTAKTPPVSLEELYPSGLHSGGLASQPGFFGEGSFHKEHKK